MPETTKPVFQRCWCWQYGRCLVNCPTADHPRPVPFTDATWKPAAYALMGKAECFACGIRTKATTDGSKALCSYCRPSRAVLVPEDPAGIEANQGDE